MTIKIWFTSDTHFGHARILEYCQRPYVDVNEMNQTLVDDWNAVVKDDDIVVHCGDVAMGRPVDTLPYMEKLKGRKIVTRGNHDSKKYVKELKKLGWVFVDYIVVNDTLIQHHYVQEDHDYDRVIHGHAHGTFKAPKQIDVGVDSLVFGSKYKPISSTMLLFQYEEFCLHRILNNLL